MKLMQTMAGSAVGGAEEFFVRLAEAFQGHGIDQRVAMRPSRSRAARLRSAGVPFVPLRFGGALDRGTVPGLAREIDRFGPDILLSWMKRATRATVRAAERARHSAVRVGRLDGYYDLKYYRGCDHLIGVTPDIVRYAADAGWPAERAHFAPNFAVHEGGAPAARESLGVPPEAPLVLAAGRLHSNKGFDTLLNAMALAGGGAFLAIAGEGRDRRKLGALARRLGLGQRVRFLGWREDIADLMATADCFVCSSRIEAFGIVVVEAWANRCPVAACAAPGPAWLIEHGADGLLSPVDDPAALAESVRTLIADRDLAGALAEAGHARYREAFTERAAVARHDYLFDKILR